MKKIEGEKHACKVHRTRTSCWSIVSREPKAMQQEKETETERKAKTKTKTKTKTKAKAKTKDNRQ